VTGTHQRGARVAYWPRMTHWERRNGLAADSHSGLSAPCLGTDEPFLKTEFHLVNKFLLLLLLLIIIIID
jgi:hypothetical protein